MASNRWGRVAAVMIALALAMGASPAAAQQRYPVEIENRFLELYAAGNYAAALVEARKLEETVKQQFGTDHRAYAFALNDLARVYDAQGRYGDAEEFYKRALAIYEKPDANQSGVAAPLHNLAIVYTKQGRYVEAEGLYKRALAINEKDLGANHPDVAGTLNDLANLYGAEGRNGEAEGLYKRALAIKEHALGANHPSVASSLNGLALVYRAQGRYREEEGLYKRALAIREHALGANHPDVAGNRRWRSRFRRSRASLMTAC